MKRYPNRPFLAAALVFAVIVSGCTELRGRNDSENGTPASSVSVEEQVNQAVNEIGGQAGQVAKDAANQAAAGLADSLDQAAASRTVSADRQAVAGGTLALDNPVGNIEVRSGSGDSILVQAEVKVYGLKQESQQKILDEAAVRIEQKGKRFNVHAVSRDGRDIWKWARSKYGNDNLSISYTVTVPPSIARFDLTADVGNLDVSGVSGRFQLSSDVGIVRLSGAGIDGASSLSTDTGSISMEVAALADGASLTAKADVGAIHASFDPGISFTLKTDTELGSVTGAKKGTEKINGGGPKVTLVSSVGAIDIQH
ncbi:hypothetical protein [Paenibacillus glufosinatiresistens]|uniref:hypothetical protein n=1 Tax=Paenibacillus glufosinatiresistens TaxID=3070657 RepID=UPI00286E8F7B|nr:hypothetical protein [Paenibacillus sp. YX.27]